MCIIVVKPKGRKLERVVLKRCWEKNSDGAGFMYATDTGIIIKKEMKNFNKIWKDYENRIIKSGLEEKKDTVFHFRIQTHGAINEDNCHPFYVNNGQNLAFCHNGILANMKASRKGDKSDTVLFRNKVLNHLPKNWMSNPGLVLLVKEFVGYSKLVFMDKNGKVDIMNAKGGYWDKGIWYSNTSYKETRALSHSFYDRRWHEGKVEGVYGDSGYNGYYDNLWDENKNSEDNGRPGYGKVWDYKQNKYVFPCDHTDNKEINDSVRSTNPLTKEITESDTLKCILDKLKSPYKIKDKKNNEEELIICKFCALPIFTMSEIENKTCIWCKKGREENNMSEEEQGDRKCQLH